MEEDILTARASRKKPIPFDFVFDLLEGVNFQTKAFFECTALYVGPKIVLILREKKEHRYDNGVWVVALPEHHKELKKVLPSMRSIRLFESEGPTTWQNLPSSADDFEKSVGVVCEMIVRGDPRIGKIPAKKKKKGK
jgi:hypothetical protein